MGPGIQSSQVHNVWFSSSKHLNFIFFIQTLSELFESQQRWPVNDGWVMSLRGRPHSAEVLWGQQCPLLILLGWFTLYSWNIPGMTSLQQVLVYGNHNPQACTITPHRKMPGLLGIYFYIKACYFHSTGTQSCLDPCDCMYVLSKSLFRPQG